VMLFAAVGVAGPRIDLIAVVQFLGPALYALGRVSLIAVVFLFAPFNAAGLFATEKQERTLELLLLADPRPWNLYLGKLVAAYIPAATLAVSVLPVLALASLLGGISVPAIVLQVALLLCALFTVCTLALLASVVAQRPAEAALLTLLTIGMWLAGAELVDNTGLLSAKLNIARLAWETDDPRAIGAPWFPSVALSITIGVCAAIAAVAILPRQIYGQAATRRRTSQQRRRPLSPVAAAARIISHDSPGLWATFHSIPGRVLLVGSFCLVMFLPWWAGTPLLIALVAYDVATSIRSAFQSGALDDLWVTMLEPKAMWRAMVRCYLRQVVVYWPGLCVAYMAAFAGENLLANGLVGLRAYSDLLTPDGGLLFVVIAAPLAAALVLVFMVILMCEDLKIAKYKGSFFVFRHVALGVCVAGWILMDVYNLKSGLSISLFTLGHPVFTVAAMIGVSVVIYASGSFGDDRRNQPLHPTPKPRGPWWNRPL